MCLLQYWWEVNKTKVITKPGVRLLRWLPACLERGGGRRASITKRRSTSYRGRRLPARDRRLRRQLPHLGALVEPSWGNLARGRQPGCCKKLPCRCGCTCGGCKLLKPLCKQHNKQNLPCKILMKEFIILVGGFTCRKMKNKHSFFVSDQV